MRGNLQVRVDEVEWGRGALKIIDLGFRDYSSTYALQLELVEKRFQGKIEDTLILVEHSPPVITMGRSAKSEHLLAGREELERRGIEVVETDRGGDITYHGPGQVVAYPILDLNRYGRDLHLILRLYEEVMLRTLKTYGLTGHRLEGLTGVWVNNKKVGAIGVAIKRWVTYHGFAFNVSPDLKNFDLIIPCGIREYGVTSLEVLLNYRVPISEVKTRIARAFSQVFRLRPPEELGLVEF